MERFNTDGIVIKTTPTAEADTVVFILTRHHGIIRAFAKGSKRTKSRLHAGASLFAYCDFSVSEKNGVFYLNEAEVKDIFFGLRTDLKALTLAQYFCEIVMKTLPEGADEPEFLRLMLNSLYLLCRQKKPLLLIKSVFELRAVSLLGYMPDLVACKACHGFQTQTMYFNCQTGALYCSECADKEHLPQVPLSVVSALRHIVFSEFEKCFSFDLPPEQLKTLNRLTECYTENCFRRRFSLLDYFYQIS